MQGCILWRSLPCCGILLGLHACISRLKIESHKFQCHICSKTRDRRWVIGHTNVPPRGIALTLGPPSPWRVLGIWLTPLVLEAILRFKTVAATGRGGGKERIKERTVRLHCADLTVASSSNTTTAAEEKNSKQTSTNRHKQVATEGRPDKKDKVYVRIGVVQLFITTYFQLHLRRIQ